MFSYVLIIFFIVIAITRAWNGKDNARQAPPVEMDKISCPNCKREYSPGHVKCPFCGEAKPSIRQGPLPSVCPGCGVPVPHATSSCPHCGMITRSQPKYSAPKANSPVPLPAQGTMAQCPDCGRHYNDSYAGCPHCRGAASGLSPSRPTSSPAPSREPEHPIRNSAVPPQPAVLPPTSRPAVSPLPGEPEQSVPTEAGEEPAQAERTVARSAQPIPHQPVTPATDSAPKPAAPPQREPARSSSTGQLPEAPVAPQAAQTDPWADFKDPWELMGAKSDSFWIDP